MRALVGSAQSLRKPTLPTAVGGGGASTSGGGAAGSNAFHKAPQRADVDGGASSSSGGGSSSGSGGGGSGSGGSGGGGSGSGSGGGGSGSSGAGPSMAPAHGLAYDDLAALSAPPPARPATLGRSDSAVARAQQFEEYQRAMSAMSQALAARAPPPAVAAVAPSLTHQNSAGGLWGRLARGVETEAELHAFFARRQAKTTGAGRELHIGSAIKVVNNAALQAFVSGKALVRDAVRAHRVADSFLFHGCPQPVAANIQADGLRMAYAANGMLGRGLYGAPDPRKSLQYCKDSTHGKFMFVCRYNLSQAKRAGPDTQHRNSIFDEFCVYDERHVAVLWMIKLA